MRLSLDEIEEAIEHCAPEEQRQLLAELPHLLKFSAEDVAWLQEGTVG